MRSSTWGYSLLIKSFKSLQSWPSSKGLRGFGTVIIALMNILWTIYPAFLKLNDWKKNSEKLLFIVQLFFLLLISIYFSLLTLIRADDCYKLMNGLSNFKDYGIPRRLKSIEEKIKITSRVCRFIIFTVMFVMLKESLSDKTCLNENTSSNTCNFLVHYYVPFHVENWQLGLIALFQMFSSYIIAMNCIYAVIFYGYTAELLVIRLEDLTEKIKKIKFNLGQKRDEKLRSTIKYHQYIVWLFNDLRNYINICIPVKVLLLLSIALSLVRISMKHYLSGIGMFIITILGLLLTNTVGQRILDNGSFVSDAIYDLNWYDAHVSLQKDVLIFLGASQRPLMMKMTIFGSISYRTMATETQRIYVWFNWIMTFMLKKI